MSDYREAFVGIDVAKQRNAIAIAEAVRGRTGPLLGEVDASDTSKRGVIQRIAAKFDRVHFSTRRVQPAMLSTGRSVPSCAVADSKEA